MAVITPVSVERPATIQRCLASVQAQTHAAAMHVLVVDGTDAQADDRQGSLPANVHIIRLPKPSEDTGATPRAIGSIYALAHHCEGLAFLDADNSWTRNHLEVAVRLAAQGAQIVVADRWICHHSTYARLFEDKAENGVKIVDTNTLAVFGAAMETATRWWRVPRRMGLRTAGVDRYLWQLIDQAQKRNAWKMVRTGVRSVDYVSRWLGHYSEIPEQAPNPAKVLEMNDGVICARWVRPVELDQDGVWHHESL